MSTAESLSADIMEMVRIESRGWGDQRNALKRIASRNRLPFWSLEHIRTGGAKTVDSDLRLGILKAYLALLEPKVSAMERKVLALREAIAEERQINADSDLLVLEHQATALADQVEARRQKLAGYREQIKGA